MNNLRNNKDIIKNVGLTLLSEGKSIRIKAHGYSMYPCIKPGSLLLIEPIKIKGPPKSGEIVAIKREQGLVVHRLVKTVVINGITNYIARGDSNAYPDKPVKLELIAGRITGAETTGENPVKADVRINSNPRYFSNRIRVIFLLISKRIF